MSNKTIKISGIQRNHLAMRQPAFVDRADSEVSEGFIWHQSPRAAKPLGRILLTDKLYWLGGFDI